MTNNVSFQITEAFKNRLNEKKDQALVEAKKELAARLFGVFEDVVEIEFEHEPLNEANVIRQGRLKLIRVRIRGGKIQRRKKVSAVKGFTLRSGKVVRMTPTERRRRKLGARRAKFKRRGKASRILIKRKRSLRKRKSLGL